jgi:serine/threonine-protein kinase
VFGEALALAPTERPAYLAAACGEDLELRREVESLLGAEAAAGDFLSRPAAEPEAAWERSQRIGPYALVEEIGRGGMGAVYRAVRDDDAFRKTVAVKLMHGGPSSEFLRRRFHQERQILAGLQHPNIAGVLDGGATEDGRPYLVMEHVEGRAVTRYCAEAGLGLRERLDLFRRICAAVQYAHQNLVVHRDIKPSNVLVTAEGVPKLLDFGIAKLLAAGVEPESAPTATMLPVMTPEYASPEQVRGEAVTTAADVYSLGVVLYELLTGRLPYELDTHSLEDIVRTVCETEPLPPSAVATLSGASLKGDLDTIVLKALRKDPARRYGSVQELSEDLRRHLVGLPVLARPDTWGYRVTKFVSRHRVAVAVAALAVLLVAAFSANTYFQSVRLRRERDKAEQVSAFLVKFFDVADPATSGGRDVTAREMLDRGVERVRSDLRDEPEVQATLLDTLGNVDKSLGRYKEAEGLLRDALAIRRRVLGRHTDVAKTTANLGVLLWRKGDYAEAESLLRESLDLYRSLNPRNHRDISIILTNLASVMADRDETAGAEALYREAVTVRRRLGIENDTQLPNMVENVAIIVAERGAYAEAEPLYREALALKRRGFGDTHPSTARSMVEVGSFLVKTGAYAEAERLYRDALPILRRSYGDKHRWVAHAMGELAALLGGKGDYGAAEELAREALAMEREVLPKGHSALAGTLAVLARILADKGDPAAAEPLLREGLAIAEAALDAEHTEVAELRSELGRVLRDRGRLGEAEESYRQALGVERAKLAAGHPTTAWTVSHLGALLLEKEGPAGAEPLLREALAAQRAALPEGHPDRAETESVLGACLAAQGRFAEAEPLLRASHEAIVAKTSGGSRASRESAARLVQLYEAWGKPAEAQRYRIGVSAPAPRR